MLRYTIHRLLQLIPVIIGVVVIVFTINYFADYGPAEVILGNNATEEEIAKKEAELGIDRPYIVQITGYFWNLITKGDMGTSYTKSVPVWKLIRERIPISLTIGLLGVILSAIIGIPLGLLGAIKQNSFWDYLATGVSIVCACIPGFWLALLLMLFFSIQLKWTPIIGLDTWKGYILPVIVAAFPGIALTARMTRSSVVENKNSDFVRTARAKGLPERSILIRHTLRNSLIPVITVVGAMVGHCLTNGVISETVFNIPGLGGLMNTSISGKDYITTQSCVLVCSIFITLMNVITDLSYAVIDPRIKAQYARRKKKTRREPG